jgi:histone H3/H4
MARKKALAWSPIRDLMKSVGAQIVQRSAVDLMIKQLEEYVKETTMKAMKFTRHAKRTKVTKEDIELVLKL